MGYTRGACLVETAFRTALVSGHHCHLTELLWGCIFPGQFQCPAKSLLFPSIKISTWEVRLWALGSIACIKEKVTAWLVLPEGCCLPRLGRQWEPCGEPAASPEASFSPPFCRYDAAATYGHDATAAAASQWAASAPSLWSSSPMATAAAAASATPSAQQQYGFQYPLAMAAK